MPKLNKNKAIIFAIVMFLGIAGMAFFRLVIDNDVGFGVTAAIGSVGAFLFCYTADYLESQKLTEEDRRLRDEEIGE